MNFWNLLSKRHFTIISHWTSKNSGAHIDVNPKSVLERKLFTMLFYTTYWKNRFFQRHLRVKSVRVEKYAIKTRKMRISAETVIKKILILFFDNLETKCCLIKKEPFNLVQKYKSYEGSKLILWNNHPGFTRSDAFFVSKPILFFENFYIFRCRI